MTEDDDLEAAWGEVFDALPAGWFVRGWLVTSGFCPCRI